MKLSDLQDEYKIFFYYLHSAHGILEDLVNNTADYLTFYGRLKNHDKALACHLEENFLYFERFLEKMNSIAEEMENIKFLELKLLSALLPKKKTTKLYYNCNYDKDIYIDSEFQLIIPKPKIRLIRK